MTEKADEARAVYDKIILRLLQPNPPMKGWGVDIISEALAAAKEAEREACARLADSMDLNTGQYIAKAIRGRRPPLVREASEGRSGER